MQQTRVDLALPHEAPALVEPILRSVPEWFGIEEATRRYIQDASTHPTWIAWHGPAAVGFLTLARHYPESAEIHCIAVHRDVHGNGIGKALVSHVEMVLTRDGALMIQVKTQGPSRPSAEYARTLRFYRSVGFVPLEEMHGLWPGIPALVLVKSLRSPS